MPRYAERLSRIMPLMFHAVSHLGAGSTESGRRLGLTNSRMAALATVMHTGQMSMSDLAASLDLPRPLATRMADELEARGLLERRSDPSDRRRVLVALTEDGRRVFDDVHREAARMLEPLLARMAEPDVDGLIRGLEALLQALHVPDGPVAPHGHTHR